MNLDAAEIPAKKRRPFSIECEGGCGIGDHLGSAKQAKAEGWMEIKPVDDNAHAYYTGLCDECWKKVLQDRKEEEEYDARTYLFPPPRKEGER